MLLQRPVVSGRPSQGSAPRVASRRPSLKPVQALTFEQGTYIALGTAAASFVGTFFVAPKFKELFKEDVQWPDIYADLVKRKVQSISAEEAYARSKKGSILVDVRLADKYLSSAPEGAVNVPLYIPIQNWDLASNIRRAGFAFFGIYGTELNPAFGSQAAAALPSKSKEIVVMCEMGGSLENKSGTTTGFQSRSLKAVHALQNAGYTKVLHMKGGYSEWIRKDLPVEVPDAPEEKEQQQEKVTAVPVLASSSRGTTGKASGTTGKASGTTGKSSGTTGKVSGTTGKVSGTTSRNSVDTVSIKAFAGKAGTYGASSRSGGRSSGSGKGEGEKENLLVSAASRFFGK